MSALSAQARLNKWDRSSAFQEGPRITGKDVGFRKGKACKTAIVVRLAVAGTIESALAEGTANRETGKGYTLATADDLPEIKQQLDDAGGSVCSWLENSKFYGLACGERHAPNRNDAFVWGGRGSGSGESDVKMLSKHFKRSVFHESVSAEIDNWMCSC